MILIPFAVLVAATLAVLCVPLWRKERKTAAIVAFLAVLGAGGLYLYLGAPDLPDRPYAGRGKDPDFRVNDIAEAMEAEFRENPSAEGYKRLAALFLVVHRYDRAIEAGRKAIANGADDAITWSRLGESLVRMNDGVVVIDALDAFKNALRRNPQDIRARFSIGLAEAQIGNFKKAVGIWRHLEKDAPPDAPWLPQVKKSIHEFSRKGGFDPAAAPPLDPSQIQMPMLGK